MNLTEISLSNLRESFGTMLNAMSVWEQASFTIFLAMTITYFSWTLYLVVSK